MHVKRKGGCAHIRGLDTHSSKERFSRTGGCDGPGKCFHSTSASRGAEEVGGGGSLTPPHSGGRGSPHRLGDLQPQGWRSRQRQSPKERPLQPAPWLVCALLTPLFLPHSMLRHLLPSRSTPATHLLFPKIFLMCSMISLLLLVSTSTRTCSPESGNGKQRGQSAKDRAARSSASSRRGDGSAFSGEAL